MIVSPLFSVSTIAETIRDAHSYTHASLFSIFQSSALIIYTFFHLPIFHYFHHSHFFYSYSNRSAVCASCPYFHLPIRWTDRLSHPTRSSIRFVRSLSFSVSFFLSLFLFVSLSLCFSLFLVCSPRAQRSPLSPTHSLTHQLTHTRTHTHTHTLSLSPSSTIPLFLSPTPTPTPTA